MHIKCPHCNHLIQITASKVSSNKLYVFQFPSFLGGADTKLVHSLRLWSKFMDITVVPNFEHQLQQKQWTDYLDNLGISYCSFKELPERLDGQAIAFSNPEYIGGERNIAQKVHQRGLRTIWGNEMFFFFPGELDTIWQGFIDVLVFPSKINHNALMPTYKHSHSYIVENYIDANDFPYKARPDRQFTIGRLSRPDTAKYPVSFPVFYERLRLKNPKYRVMAWSEEIASKYRWYLFGPEWDLLKPEAETQLDFLYSLDAFVYPLGHTFIESWGRSTVEAMLTGCVPVVQSGHNFRYLIDHGKTGFVCDYYEDFRDACQKLQDDKALREEMGKRASMAARVICDPRRHTEIWKRVFDV